MNTIESLTECAELSLKEQDVNEYNCDIRILIDNKPCICHSVSIACREFMFYSDRGTITFFVDTYGDDFTFELYDYDLTE